MINNLAIIGLGGIGSYFIRGLSELIKSGVITSNMLNNNQIRLKIYNSKKIFLDLRANGNHLCDEDNNIIKIGKYAFRIV